MLLQQECVRFNGINGSNGASLFPPMSTREIASMAAGLTRNPWEVADLKLHHQLVSEDGLGVIFGVDVKRLEEAGWGVVFPHGVASEIREAVAPLLRFRQSAASRKKERLYRELEYRPGESKARFLARYGVGPGPVDPDVLPYYLLLIGGPDSIPFSFQYQLDVQFAVGRLHFPEVEEYDLYSQSLIEIESSPPVRSRSMALFGVANPDDPATRRSCHDLVLPLAAELERSWGDGSMEKRPWAFETVTREDATKSRLATLLGGEQTPALLFTASHGVGFSIEDSRQLEHQGSLLCQDWPGPNRWRKRIPSAQYFSADDVGSRADLRGLVSFHFACYGGGTPLHDAFSHRSGGKAREQIAPHSFVARLPQRLLAHEGGGALAVIAHVDRAWTYSFDWLHAKRQLAVFRSTFESLFEGVPVGAAMEFFNQRYAELSSDLTYQIEEFQYGGEADFLTLPSLWTANNDARSYIVLGDPAVRLSIPD